MEKILYASGTQYHEMASMLKKRQLQSLRCMRKGRIVITSVNRHHYFDSAYFVGDFEDKADPGSDAFTVL